MCVICIDMSGQFRRSDFLPEDMVSDLAVVAGQRAAAPGPLGYYDLDDRGGTGPNGKTSLLPGDAGTQITRTNARWSTNLGDAATVTYAFRSTAPVTMPSDTAGFSQFNAAQIAATELMLQGWSDVARITFVREGSGTSGPTAYSNAATMLFGNYSSGQAGAAAFAYLPGSLPGSASHSAVQGDVWVNSSQPTNANPQYLAYGYTALLHEIGHAIGLSHPATYNAGDGVTITYSEHAQYYEDSRQYTVMSYFSESSTGGAFGGRYASAPLLDDIAAAQRLYGANMTTRTGDTVYGFNSTADRVWYNAGSQISPQSVIFAVWDAGGTDTLDFSGYNHVGTIDLRQGHFSSVGGLVGNVSIGMGAVIENAVGGLGADTIIGNSADNRLTGGAGNDNIWGGNGSDTAVFSGNRSAYTITYGTETINGQQYRITTVSGPDGTDVLRGVETLQFADQTFTVANTQAAGEVMEGDATSETLTGTAYGDLIYGADGNDTINGGDGDDTISGGRGNDTLTGGNGTDTLSYGGSTGSVTVNMTTGTSSGASGSDTFSGFEILQGSAFSDTLTGSAAGDSIYGFGGVDTINGEGGNDVLVAGAGTMVAAEDVVKSSSVANLSIAAAVNVDANFDRMDDAGVVNATTTPHAVIRGSGSGGGQEYYAFTVTAGAACIFDINGAGFDTTIRIFDASGNQLAWNDDGTAGTDSYLEHTFATAGTYYIAVGAWKSETGEGSTTSGPVPFNGNYVLNVSIPGHSFVPAVGLGSTLNGGAGDDLLQSGSSNDTLNGGDGNDTARYSGARADYTIVDLGGGSFRVTGPDGTGTDTLNAVERIQFSDQTIDLLAPSGPNIINGTGNGETLTGTANIDHIFGLAGNDIINGLGADDLLVGGGGNDTLDGGDGQDTVEFSAPQREIYFEAFAGGWYAHSGLNETDTLISIENARSAGETSTGLSQYVAGSFNAWAYLAAYSDLQALFGANPVAAFRHYQEYGRSEGRSDTAFDALTYAASNLDLALLFRGNAMASAEHYIRFGLSEGRSINTFDGLTYLATYTDLALLFGANAQAGVRHYLDFGVVEGRATNGFNALNYLATYTDLALLFGANAEAGTLHYLQYGAHEGRAQSGFDALTYMASYQDLALLFGPNAQEGTLHYLNYGVHEGRAQTGFDKVAYLLTQTDLAGWGADGALVHYLQYGVHEGRSADGAFGREQTDQRTGLDDGSQAGTLTANDRDWFEVNAIAGTALDLQVTGLGSGTLQLYDAGGHLVANGSAALNFTPTASGAYYLVVSNTGGAAGSYVVSATGQGAPAVTLPPLAEVDTKGGALVLPAEIDGKDGALVLPAEIDGKDGTLVLPAEIDGKDGALVLPGLVNDDAWVIPADVADLAKAWVTDQPPVLPELDDLGSWAKDTPEFPDPWVLPPGDATTGVDGWSPGDARDHIRLFFEESSTTDWLV